MMNGCIFLCKEELAADNGDVKAELLRMMNAKRDNISYTLAPLSSPLIYFSLVITAESSLHERKLWYDRYLRI